MKNLLKISLLLLTGLLVVTSCNKEEGLEQPELLSMTEIYEIGVQHNEALAHTLEGLKNANISEIQNSVEMNELLNRELSSYYDQTFERSGVETANQFSKREVVRYSSRTNLRENGISPLEQSISENSGHLSQGQIELLQDLDQVLASTTSDINVTLLALEDIQARANSLTDEEAQVILVGAEIGKASIAYWYENLVEWESIINSGNSSNARVLWFSWSDVAGSDVAGAVGGAVGAAVVNVIPGAGQVAYGAAILGGAAAGSAGNAVYQVWQQIL